MIELGQFFAGHRLARLACQGLRAVRIEPGGRLEELQGFGALLAGLVLQSELDERLRILGVLRSRLVEGGDGIDPGEDRLDPLQEFFGRRLVAGDPVDLLSVPVQEEEYRSAAYAEPLDQALARDIPPPGSKEDEILFEELGELGLIVKLLDQQLTVPSTVLLEKVEKQELARGLSFGLGVFERPCLPILAEGRADSEGREQNYEGPLSHLDTSLYSRVLNRNGQDEDRASTVSLVLDGCGFCRESDYQHFAARH